MAIMPDYLRLTEEEERQLEAERKQAKIRHEKKKRAARRQGRYDFPDSPYESSWAYEEEFRRRSRA